MNQQVNNNFTKQFIPHANANISFHIKLIIDMLLNKVHEFVVAFDQIAPNDIPIVISIQIANAVYGIGFMMRQGGDDCFICSKKQNCSKCITALPGLHIFPVQPGATKNFVISHRFPRVMRRLVSGHYPNSVD